MDLEETRRRLWRYRADCSLMASWLARGPVAPKHWIDEVRQEVAFLEKAIAELETQEKALTAGLTPPRQTSPKHPPKVKKRPRRFDAIDPTAGMNKIAARVAKEQWWLREVRGPLEVLSKASRRVIRKHLNDDDGQAGFDAAARAAEEL